LHVGGNEDDDDNEEEINMPPFKVAVSPVVSLALVRGGTIVDKVEEKGEAMETGLRRQLEEECTIAEEKSEEVGEFVVFYYDLGPRQEGSYCNGQLQAMQHYLLCK
jgi:hypothetical protein